MDFSAAATNQFKATRESSNSKFRFMLYFSSKDGLKAGLEGRESFTGRELTVQLIIYFPLMALERLNDMFDRRKR